MKQTHVFVRHEDSRLFTTHHIIKKQNAVFLVDTARRIYAQPDSQNLTLLRVLSVGL